MKNKKYKKKKVWRLMKNGITSDYQNSLCNGYNNPVWFHHGPSVLY